MNCCSGRTSERATDNRSRREPLKGHVGFGRRGIPEHKLGVPIVRVDRLMDVSVDGVGSEVGRTT